MASLTGQQIQNSYQGLLKTENNGALPVDKTYITDGEGNATGLYFWKQYAAMGVTNQGQPAVQPYLEVQNTNFTLGNSPMGSSGATNLAFTDTNGTITYSLSQNRFGGLNYYNYKDGQPHIFQGTGSNSRIEMDFFNNTNNSDNWYTGFLQSVTDLQVSGSDLTLTRQGTAPLTVTLPGGGGSSYTYKSNQYYTPNAYDAGIGGTYSFFTNTCIFHPIFLPSGTLSEAAIKVETTSPDANDTRLVLYTAGATSSTKHPYGTPSELVADFGIIDTSVGGLVQINTNISIDEGLYYYGIYQEGPFDAAFRVYDYNGGINGRATNGRVIIDDLTSLDTTSGSYPAWYANFGAAWTPQQTITNGFSFSSDKTSMYFKMS